MTEIKKPGVQGAIPYRIGRHGPHVALAYLNTTTGTGRRYKLYSAEPSTSGVMATERGRFDVSARYLAGLSVVAVLFGIVSVLFGGPAVTTAGVLAVMVSAVALLLAVGKYLAD